MNILRYQFIDSPAGSYNQLLGDLVKKRRYYFEDVSADELKKALPELKALENKIQTLDSGTSRQSRNYLTEIEQALEKEANLESELLEEITWSCNVTVPVATDFTFAMDDCKFDFENYKSVYTLSFYDYHGKDENQLAIEIVKDIFRSICNNHGVIFLDRTTNHPNR